MRKMISVIPLIYICITLAGCAGNTPARNNTGSSTFSQADAISMVVKDNPDFPSNPSETVTKRLPTGGPEGAGTNVKYTTSVEKSGQSGYTVTLTKDWGITVDGTYVKSYWEYAVTPSKVTLLKKVDNDYLPNTMK
jgi:hypothetical protein